MTGQTEGELSGKNGRKKGQKYQPLRHKKGTPKRLRKAGDKGRKGFMGKKLIEKGQGL